MSAAYETDGIIFKWGCEHKDSVIDYELDTIKYIKV